MEKKDRLVEDRDGFSSVGADDGREVIEILSSVVPFGKGRVKISQIPVTDGAPAAGRKVAEMHLPREVIIGCFLRGDEICIPHGETRILAGDTLIVISSDKQKDAAIKMLTGR